MTQSTALDKPGVRLMLNKVPEVTIWFWVIKILCTTVGESFADWVNMTLGVGLVNTAVLFTVIFGVVLAVQMRLRQYVPFAYWLTVVVVSVTGTLYTDILTDHLGVPLWISTTVFSVLLAAVFAVWYAREGTLSIHSIFSRRREAFYWATVFLTFVLGTAAGDLTADTLKLGFLGSGFVFLAMILVPLVAHRWFGFNEVFRFWVAYILTRPLGASFADWMSAAHGHGGLGLGPGKVSVLWAAAIAAMVFWMAMRRSQELPTLETSRI